MHKNVKEQEMTSPQLCLLAYQTCQWWNAVFIQAKRFFDTLDKAHGGTPWDEDGANDMFVAERIFLIMAIYHSIENLQKLDIELQRANDVTLQKVLQKIEAVAPFNNIKNLRDMNEHGLDYLINKGRKQDSFCSTIKKGDYKVSTTANLTFLHGDAKLFLLGNVQIDKLLIVMKNQMPIVSKKTKEIFDREFSR